MKRSPAIGLHELGQSLWLDFISDGLITSGGLAKLVADGAVYGVTSNPTIFRAAIGGDKDGYPAAIARLAAEGRSPEAIYDTLAFHDITRTADILAPVYERGTGRDGFVSLEVAPDLAHDTDGTVAEAKRLWKAVDKRNLLVKVPATAEGIPAIEALLADGVSINVTLIFSRPQYAEVARAFRRGIEKRLASGASLDHLHSVASVFVSRLDTAVDKDLENRIAKASAAERPRLEALRGAAAVANALDVWEEYRAQFFGASFEPLKGKGARPQWLLWGSTGTKNPAYSDVKYVEELAGPDSINTVPRETLDAWIDHGRVEGNRLDPRLETARKTREAFAAVDLSLQAHCTKLLADGVDSFARSFREMMDTIRERSAALAPRR